MSQCDDNFEKLEQQRVRGLAGAIKGVLVDLPVSLPGVTIDVPMLIGFLSSVRQEEQDVGAVLIAIPPIVFCYLGNGNPAGAQKCNTLLNLMAQTGHQLQLADNALTLMIVNAAFGITPAFLEWMAHAQEALGNAVSLATQAAQL